MVSATNVERRHPAGIAGEAAAYIYCRFMLRAMRFTSAAAIVLGVSLIAAPPVPACDLCGCFMPQHDASQGFQIGFAEQYSSLSNLYMDGSKVSNPNDQYMNSSYSVMLVNYQFNPRYALQLNMPLVYRSFQRVELNNIQHGTESGIGDMLLVGTYIPFQRKNPYSQFRWKLMAGVKFPTGNPDRIGEELTEAPAPETADSSGQESAVHGHDLALGSGSWDGLIGADVSGQNARWYYMASLQYAIRTRGDFDYKYANDLLWYGGPGYYLARKPEYTMGIQALVAGENKGEDELGNVKTEDTAVTSAYLGPSVMMGIKRVVMANVDVGFPLYINNSGLQTVPKYRIRFGLTWMFQ